MRPEGVLRLTFCDIMLPRFCSGKYSEIADVAPLRGALFVCRRNPWATSLCSSPTVIELAPLRGAWLAALVFVVNCSFFIASVESHSSVALLYIIRCDGAWRQTGLMADFARLQKMPFGVAKDAESRRNRCPFARRKGIYRIMGVHGLIRGTDRVVWRLGLTCVMYGSLLICLKYA